MIAPFVAGREVCDDLGCDKPRLFALIAGYMERQLVTVLLFRPKLLSFAAYVITDNVVGRVKYISRRAVILLQPDYPRVFVFALKAQDIFNRRASEFINTLIIVPDDADVLAGRREGSPAYIGDCSCPDTRRSKRI